MDLAAIFPPPYGFKRQDRLSLPDSFLDFPELVNAVGRDEGKTGLPDDVLCPRSQEAALRRSSNW